MHCLEVEFAQSDDSVRDLDDCNDAGAEGGGFGHCEEYLVSRGLARGRVNERRAYE